MTTKQPAARWFEYWGRTRLMAERPILRLGEVFVARAMQFVTQGRLSRTGAQATAAIAGALVRYYYYLMGEESTDIMAVAYLGDMHCRCRLLQGMLRALEGRREVYRLPETGVTPVLLYGAEAARERLLAYDPAIMDKATTASVERDGELILSALRWSVNIVVQAGEAPPPLLRAGPAPEPPAPPVPPAAPAGNPPIWQ